ncbi:MAG TPA: LamG-like jellyroll fold domain-containing protein [Acidimicrobiia bacterium]
MRLRHAVVAVATAAAVLPAAASPAGAELTDDVVRTWGVSGLAPAVTTAIPSEVWAIEQIGNTIYVGGRFTTVIERRNREEYDQPFLAAFDATTGDWIDWWRPDLDGSVFSLQRSPDGSRLFVGGEFATVNGHPMTSGLVALDPASGTIDPSFRASLDNFFSPNPGVVRDLAIRGTWLYAAGNFTHVTTLPNFTRRAVSKVMRVSLANGEVDLDWRPTVTGGSVWGIAPSPNGQRVYLAGIFEAVNGEDDSEYFWTVNGTNGATVQGLEPIQFNANQRDQFDVAAVGDKVFLGGSQHFLQVLDAADLSVEQTFFTGQGSNNLTGGGDFQDLEVVGDRVYASCHCFASIWQGNQFLGDISGLAGFEADTGDFIDSWPDVPPGSTGPWAIHGAGDGCLWLGGDMSPAGFPFINAVVKLCDEAGPGPPVGPPLQEPPPDTSNPSVPGSVGAAVIDDTDVEVSWTASSDANGIAHYNVYRNGNKIGETAETSYRFVQPAAGTFTFSVRAVDPSQNLSAAGGAAPLAVPPVPGKAEILIDAGFDSGANGFTYSDDTFRGTSEPDYADGARFPYAGYRRGGLEVALGGVDDVDGFGMSGGFTRQFTLDEPTAVYISLRTLVIQSSAYEPDEYTESLVAIDGDLVGFEPDGEITRVADGGSSGWVEFERELGVLGAGTHTIVVGGYNNKKTFANEFGQVNFDDLLVAGTAPGVGIAAPPNGGSVDVGSNVAIRVGARDVQDPLGSLSVEVRVDGGSWTAAAWNAANLRYQSSWASQGHGEGPVTVEARATDSDGNTTHAAPVTFTLGQVDEEYAEVVVADDPVAYWRLGETSGSSAADASGSGNTARYRADVDLGRPALIDDDDGAVRLDGSKARISVPDSQDLNKAPVTRYTVEAWIRVADASDGRQVVYEQGGKRRGLALYIRQGKVWAGAWDVTDNGGDTPWGPVFIKKKITSGQVHHVVMVYDRGDDELRLFVDGVKVREGSGIGRLHPHSANIGVGAMIDETRFDNGVASGEKGKYFDGVIDEVAVYRKALRKASIVDHFQVGIG